MVGRIVIEKYLLNRFMLCSDVCKKLIPAEKYNSRFMFLFEIVVHVRDNYVRVIDEDASYERVLQRRLC